MNYLYKYACPLAVVVMALMLLDSRNSRKVTFEITSESNQLFEGKISARKSMPTKSLWHKLDEVEFNSLQPPSGEGVWFAKQKERHLEGDLEIRITDDDQQFSIKLKTLQLKLIEDGRYRGYWKIPPKEIARIQQ